MSDSPDTPPGTEVIFRQKRLEGLAISREKLVRIVHAADIHIGFKQYGSDVRKRDFGLQLEKILDIAQESRAAVIVLSGDIFDSQHPSPEDLVDYMMFLKKCVGRKIKVLAITGNHDRVAGSFIDPNGAVPFNWTDAAYTIFPESLKQIYDIDISIGGFSWTPSKEKIAAYLKECNGEEPFCAHEVVAMHQSCSEFLPKIASCEMELYSLEGVAQYVALGDLHLNKLAVIESGKGTTIVAYPGSTEVCSINEPLKKYVNLVDFVKVEDRYVLHSVHRTPISTRPLIVCKDIRTKEQMDAEVAKIVQEVRAGALGERQKPVVHVEYDRDISPLYVDSKMQEILDAGALIVIPHPKTFSAAALTVSESRTIADAQMPEILKEFMPDSPEELAVAQRIWESPEKAFEIASELNPKKRNEIEDQKTDAKKLVPTPQPGDTV